MKSLLLIIGSILSAGAAPGYSQNLKPISFNLFAGIDWHGALTSNGLDVSAIIPTHHPDYCYGGPCIPYNYERNFQGLGLNVGGGVRISNWELLLGTEMRYDEIYFSFDGPDLKSHKEFIFNPEVRLQRWMARSQSPQYVGLSYKLINTGKEFQFFDNIEGVDKTFYLETPSVVFRYGRSIRRSRFFGEFQLYYFFDGLPHNPYGPYFMYGISLYSRFKIQGQSAR